MNWADYGIVGLILAGIFGTLGVTARVLYKRLLSDTGLLTRIGERHIEYVDANQKATETLVELSKKHEKHLADLSRMHDDVDSKFSTVRTNRAIQLLGEAQACVIKGDMANALQALERLEVIFKS